MRVWIRGNIYDSRLEPVVMELTSGEKLLVEDMGEEEKKLCFYPKPIDLKIIAKIMSFEGAKYPPAPSIRWIENQIKSGRSI